MEAYGKFAKVYDIFMDDTPYEKWGDFIEDRLKNDGIENGIVCELGCGTGVLTRKMADKGYDMIGIDNSEDMLQMAYESGGDGILYLNQDIREFELYGTVKAFFSVCNTMNYLTEKGDLETVLRLANNYLDPGGLFIFDFNTTHLYRDVIGNKTIAENREDASFIWENYFDEESRINEYDVTFFEKTDNEGLYEKFEELHLQRAFDLDEVRESVERAGMIFECALDAETLAEPEKESETIYVIAREKGK